MNYIKLIWFISLINFSFISYVEAICFYADKNKILSLQKQYMFFAYRNEGNRYILLDSDEILLYVNTDLLEIYILFKKLLTDPDDEGHVFYKQGEPSLLIKFGEEYSCISKSSCINKEINALLKHYNFSISNQTKKKITETIKNYTLVKVFCKKI